MKLKPCPFCGSSAVLRESHPRLPNGTEDTIFLVRCTLPECQAATIDWFPASAAVEAWNRRTNAAPHGRDDRSVP
jgi:Lar family restriction alleviation protein